MDNDRRTCAREGCDNPLPSWSRADRLYCPDAECRRQRSRESSRRSRRKHRPRRLRKRRTIDEQLALEPGGAEQLEYVPIGDEARRHAEALTWALEQAEALRPQAVAETKELARQAA